MKHNWDRSAAWFDYDADLNAANGGTDVDSDDSNEPACSVKHLPSRLLGREGEGNIFEGKKSESWVVWWVKAKSPFYPMKVMPMMLEILKQNG